MLPTTVGMNDPHMRRKEREKGRREEGGRGERENRRGEGGERERERKNLAVSVTT